MKIISALLSISLISLLSGCGSDDKDSNTAASTAPAANLKAKCVTTYPFNGQNLVACAEVDQVNADQRAAFETVVCNNEELPGVYTADELCSTEAVIDTCEVTVVALALDMKIKYYADYSTVTAAMDCNQRKQQASQQ
jgi:hypothetical protein